MPRHGPSEWEDGDDATRTVEAMVARATSAEAGARPVTALNPEAGGHAITTEPRELGAALRAGERTRQRFPYYERRYGDRGRRFTHSDSAWIVTLTHLPHRAEAQLRWLGALLAARGMPRWLLEEHLETLHAELLSSVPEERAAYDCLHQVTAVFRAERLSHLDEATSSELAQGFDRRVGPTVVAALPEAGRLIVAAAAEERVGLDRVVDSLMEWLADPTRFPAEWVAAATETLASARDAARG
jgi:hypothetical protein